MSKMTNSMKEKFDKQFDSFCNESLLKTEALVVAQKHNKFSSFAQHFHSICTKTLKLQEDSVISALSRIEYTMLYSNFINRRYLASVFLYDDKGYCDEKQRLVGEFEISPLFFFFDELWDKVLSERKRYAGKVSIKDVNTCMFEALPCFYSYLINIARFVVRDCLDKGPFADIVKNDLFRVCVGDYMAETEPVYIHNKNKDVTVLKEWFESRRPYYYVHRDCSGLDLSGGSFESTVLRYIQLRNAVLNDVILDNSTLIGADFYRTQMENSSLDFTSIYEADFSQAQLKDTSFRFVRGGAGLPDTKKWRHVGFYPVSFRNADLTNADFHGAYLSGADFRGATLSGADFTDAILDDAVFSSKELALSDDQMQNITIELS